MYNAQGSSPTLIGCSFGGNTAEDEGGGIYSDFGGTTVTSSTISGNSATFGGGISSKGDLDVTSSTISGNTASLGGGIYNFLGTQSVNSSIVSGN